jgi:two-component system cell cycle response regulator DivK
VTKVLYIEDNDDNVYMLKMRLELLGDFEVLAAEDGQKGCEMAVSECPDIILMDLEMPVVDGWEATRRLKGNPQTRDIPVIVLSAHALAGEREEAIAAGCDEFDTTPIEFDRLVATVRRVRAYAEYFWVLLESCHARLVPDSPHPSVISKGWIWHPSDSEQLRSVPRT